MPRLTQLAVIAAVALAPLSTQAQSSALVGDWAVEITAGMRIENETPTPLRAKARLSIVLQGDSLIATLTVEPNAEVQARPPARFAAAKSSGNAVDFVQRSQATLNVNGDERQATVISTWALAADGDAIKGSVSREMEGMSMPGMPSQPVSGTRIK